MSIEKLERDLLDKCAKLAQQDATKQKKNYR